MKKRIIALILTLAICLGLAPSGFAANIQPRASENLDRQNYAYNYYKSTIKSYLYENSIGGLTRVEFLYDGETPPEVLVEDYDSQFQLQASRMVPIEDLYLWGGFYAGTDYNFLIFGTGNGQEDDTREVIRVIKYDKSWNKLGYASLYGADTVIPFEAGPLRCAEGNGYLYIRTCHKMYTASDGKNHQSSLMIGVRESDMTITEAWGNVEYSTGYVSHSFNQFILVDSQDRIISLDHGDAYPRALLLQRYSAKAGSKNFSNYDIGGGRTMAYDKEAEEAELLTFPGAIGENYTGCFVGGFAETSNGYVAAYSGNGSGAPSTVYLSFVGENLDVNKVAVGGGGKTFTPVLAPTGLDGGYVMWQLNDDSYNWFELDNTLYYAHYDANGNVGQVQTTKGSLSDCAPIFWNGKLVWYVTNESAPVFYTLDSSGVTAIPANGASRPTNPTAPSNPPTPSGGFSDVKSGDYFAEPVNWAIENEITNGTSATMFSPNETCSTAHILTFLWRSQGEPEPRGTASFTNLNSGEYYSKAALWAKENGLVTGSTFGANAPCTRAMVVTYLWKLAGSPPAGNGGFSDVPIGSDYAQAVAWAVGQGITNGTSNTTFSPKDTCTRGQIVTFLYRAYA